MKNYPIQIMNLNDLIKFHAYIRKNHIKGNVVQMNYSCKASSLVGILIALPLDSASLVVDESAKAEITAIEAQLPAGTLRAS